MKEPNVNINQVNALLLNKSLTTALHLMPDKVYPFYLEFVDDCIKLNIISDDYFTGCWLVPDINPKTKAFRFKTGRGKELALTLNTHGFKSLTNYKVVDIIPKYGFTITKEEL